MITTLLAGMGDAMIRALWYGAQLPWRVADAWAATLWAIRARDEPSRAHACYGRVARPFQVLVVV